MRQAYLEIALIYIHSSGIAMIKEGSSIEILSGALSESEDEASSVKTSKESLTSSRRKRKVCKFHMDQAGFLQALENLENHKKKFHAWKIHGI